MEIDKHKIDKWTNTLQEVIKKIWTSATLRRIVQWELLITLMRS